MRDASSSVVSPTRSNDAFTSPGNSGINPMRRSSFKMEGNTPRNNNADAYATPEKVLS